MSLHNEAFSAAVLAKSILGGLDETKPDTAIPTATLKLLCVALVDSQMSGHAVHDAAAKMVGERMAGFGEALKARDHAAR
jgi:hypothetical protein